MKDTVSSEIDTDISLSKNIVTLELDKQVCSLEDRLHPEDYGAVQNKNAPAHPASMRKAEKLEFCN